MYLCLKRNPLTVLYPIYFRRKHHIIAYSIIFTTTNSLNSHIFQQSDSALMDMQRPSADTANIYGCECTYAAYNFHGKDCRVLKEQRQRLSNNAIERGSPNCLTRLSPEGRRERLQRALSDYTGSKRVPDGCKLLYHQTAPQVAETILRTQTMRGGDNGAVGGAMYFALSAEATEGKATQKGSVLRCLVYVGDAFTTEHTDVKFTKEDLLRIGLDSIHKVGFSTGEEYAIFSPDQVLLMERC